jgi:hypothetical protein
MMEWFLGRLPHRAKLHVLVAELVQPPAAQQRPREVRICHHHSLQGGCIAWSNCSSRLGIGRAEASTS